MLIIIVSSVPEKRKEAGMDTTQWLALTAGAINILAFWRYNREVFTGGTRPNAATWFLWAFVLLVNATTYYGMRVDWATLVVMGVDTTLCNVTFFFLLYKGRFGRLNTGEWVAVWLSVGAMALWWMKSAEAGNMMTQIPVVLSFLPILKDTRDGRTIEDPWVWILFTISFGISAIVVYLTWSGRINDFVYPLISVVLHAAMTFYAFRGRRLYV